LPIRRACRGWGREIPSAGFSANFSQSPRQNLLKKPCRMNFSSTANHHIAAGAQPAYTAALRNFSTLRGNA